MKLWRWRSLILTTLSLSGSTIGFGAQVLLAKTFGISNSVDAYFFALGAPLFAGGLVSGAMNFYLTPKLRQQHIAAKIGLPNTPSISDVLRLAWWLNALTVAIGVVALPLHWWGLPDRSAIRFESQLPILMCGAWLFAGALVHQSTVSALLSSRDRLKQAALLPLFPPAMSAIFILVAGEKFGLAAVLGGQLAGSAAAVVLGRFFLWSEISAVKQSHSSSSLLRSVLRGLPFAALAIACFSSYPLLDSILAPHAGARIMAQISYAQRIIIGMGTLLVAAPLATLTNQFSDLARNGSFPEYIRKFHQSIIVSLALSTLLAVALVTEGSTIVGVLFGRGKFDGNDVEMVGRATGWMAPGMVLMLLSSLTFRAGFALKGGARALAPVGLVWIISYSIMGGLLLQYGVIGLALSYSATWLLTSATALVAMYSCARRHFNDIS